MTQWCSSTTSVRKVRARSSEGFRVLALGTAAASACPTAEIDVMWASRPGCCAECCSREPDSARPNVCCFATEDLNGRRQIYVSCAEQTSMPGHDRWETAYATSSIVTLSG